MRARLPVALAALLLGGCGELLVIPDEGDPIPGEIPVVMQGVRMTTYGSRGAPSQIVEAEEVSLYQGQQRATLENLRLEFYEGTELLSTLEADHGTADLLTDNFHSAARTRLIKMTRYDSGAIIYTETFTYDPEENRLFTDDPFTMVQMRDDGSAQVISGVGVSMDPRMEEGIEMRDADWRIVSGFDAEAFDQEIRPIREETTL